MGLQQAFAGGERPACSERLDSTVRAGCDGGNAGFWCSGLFSKHSHTMRKSMTEERTFSED